MKLEKKSTQQ